MNKRMRWWLVSIFICAVVVALLELWINKAIPGMVAVPEENRSPPAPSVDADRSQMRARQLAPDQQCVSGTVVTVRPNYAVQMVRDGRIVHCKGRLADQPIR